METAKKTFRKFFRSTGAFICLLAGMIGSANDVNANAPIYEDYPYAELFTEGKEWIWYHFSCDPYSRGKYNAHEIVTVKVDGSKIIDGIECKRLKLERKFGHGYCNACDFWFNRDHFNLMEDFTYNFVGSFPEEAYVYEKDRKIYFYRNPGVRYTSDGNDIEPCDPYFDLYMDLNISIGDRGPNMGIIDTDELIYIDGKPHRRITGKYDEDEDVEDWEVSEWIEGIGATAGLSRYKQFFWFSNIGVSGMSGPDYYRLAYVIDNGKVIFDQSDVLRNLGMEVDIPAAAVESIKADDEHSHKYFDLQGRPISAPLRNQLYIHDGKIRLQH